VDYALYLKEDRTPLGTKAGTYTQGTYTNLTWYSEHSKQSRHFYCIHHHAVLLSVTN